MPSSFTTNLRLTLPATGENTGTWGTLVNTGITTLIDSSIAGTASVTMTDADYTLTNLNGTTDEARCMFINLTGTLSTTRNVICPSVSKLYFVYNNTSGGQSIVFKTSAGSGITITNGNRAALYCNGTNVVYAFDQADIGNLDVTNLEVTNIKAKDGTASATIANTTGAFTVSAPFATTGNTTLGDASTDTVQVNGYMGVGGAPDTSHLLYVSNSPQTGTSQNGITSIVTGTSAATTAIRGFTSRPTTAAAAFTVTDLIGYLALNPTKGAGSTITNQHGIRIDDQTQGTNNFGVTSLVSSGSNKWNIYASGTANNAFAGNVRIGSTTAPTNALDVTGSFTVSGNATLGDATTDTVTVNGYMGVGTSASSSRGLQVVTSSLTGADQIALSGQVTGTSAATASVRAVQATAGTAAAAFTSADVIGFQATDASKGAGSTITNQHGIRIADQTQGTNNFGVTSLVSSGSNKWNIYASGTAANYFAGNVQFAAGSAASPALTRFGDDNTGIFFPAADTIAFAEGGVESMRIDSAGNVSVGTTSSLGKLTVTSSSSGASTTGVVISNPNNGVAGTAARLHFDITNSLARGSYIECVNTTGTNNPTALVFATNAASASAVERMRIDSAGNVGVGTTNIVGSALGSNGKALSLSLESDINGNSASSSVSIGAKLISFSGIAGPSNYVAASLALHQTGSVEGIGEFRFSTGDGAGTLTERMRLDSVGNLGLGTTNPTPGDVTGTPALTLRGTDARINIGTAASDMANGDIATLSFIAEDPRTTSSVVRNLAMIKAIYAGSNTTLDTNLTFSTAAASSTASERARITSNGFLLIGTTVSNGVGGSAGTGTLQIETPNSASNLSVARNTADATGPRVFLGKSRGAAAGGTTVVASGDSLGEIYFNGTDGTNYIPAALIAAQVDGTPGTNDMPGRLVFRTTADGANTTTERMRIDSAGNVGIGVTPSAWNSSVKAIDLPTNGYVAAANYLGITANAYEASGGTFTYRTTDFANLYQQYNGVHSWHNAPSGTAGNAITFTQAMTLDASGNLGLGVTPNAWNTTEYRAMQIGLGASFYGRLVAGDADKAGMAANAVFDQTDNRWEYIATDSASRYDQTGGGHYWYTAASGTAGAAITFTDAMALDASGNLALGGTSVIGGARADFRQNSNGNYSTTFTTATTKTLLHLRDLSDVSIYPTTFSTLLFGAGDLGAAYATITCIREASQSSAIAFGTASGSSNTTERARIDSSGNVGIGVTPSTWQAGWKCIELGNAGNAVVNDAATSLRLTSNARYAGSAWLYASTNVAANYSINGGAHAWSIAPSGTAGTAITFTQAMTLDASGNLLVGTTSMFANRRLQADGGATPAGGFKTTSATNEVLTVWNSAASGDNRFIEFQTDAGNTARGSIDYNRAGGLVRYNTTSDYRAKDIIGPLTNTGATIDALKVYEGVMKGATQSRPMLVAHEAQEHAPYAVSGVKDEVNEDGTPKYQQIDVSSLVPLLLAEIQSLRARVAALEAN